MKKVASLFFVALGSVIFLIFIALTIYGFAFEEMSDISRLFLLKGFCAGSIVVILGALIAILKKTLNPLCL